MRPEERGRPPDMLTRSFSIQGTTADAGGGDRLEVLRLKGPPAGTIKLEMQIACAFDRGGER